MKENISRALRWGTILAATSGGPLLGAVIFGGQAGWYLLAILTTTTYIGVVVAAGILRVAGADVRAGDAAAMVTLAGFVGGGGIIVLVACAGGCAW